MIKFACNKLGRDKGLEGFKSENITPTYRLLSGKELCDALNLKLLEEAQEVLEVTNRQELIFELADVLEVIDGIKKAQGISADEIAAAKEGKLQQRGGFQKGLFIETIEMEESNPKVRHFRASPDKYPEI